jgi:hypothetical protein
MVAEQAYNPENPTREDCIVGFLAGYGDGLTAAPVNEHLIEMGFTPRARFHDEMRALVTGGFVEKIHGPREPSYRFTTTGRAWAALKYGYDWLIAKGES